MHSCKDEREDIQSFENYLQDNFFNGNDVTIIPKHNLDVLQIKIGEDERPIYHLGDGIQTIIINTFPLFQYKQQLLLFIEEPELTLHPSMQRKLMEIFCSDDFPNVQVFVTTHSNHFLDLVYDYEDKVSIYSCKKENENYFSLKNITSQKQIIGLLGIRTSSVFLTNSIVWVEGVTNRKYIRYFIELYKKKKKFVARYKEDAHYVITEYGGSNITHFNFDQEDPRVDAIDVSSINHNNYLIADNDLYDLNTGIKKGKRIIDEKGRRLLTLKKTLSTNFYAGHIEIENCIPYKAFEAYFNKKKDNNRITNYSIKDHYESDDKFNALVKANKIGDVLKKIFIAFEGDNKDISIIGGKNKVADEMIRTMKSLDVKFDDLPDFAKKMTRNIFTFIKNNNS